MFNLSTVRTVLGFAAGLGGSMIANTYVMTAVKHQNVITQVIGALGGIGLSYQVSKVAESGMLGAFDDVTNVLGINQK